MKVLLLTIVFVLVAMGPQTTQAQIFQSPEAAKRKPNVAVCSRQDKKIANQYQDTLKDLSKERLSPSKRQEKIRQLDQLYRNDKKMKYLTGVLVRCKDEVNLNNY